MSDDVIGNKGTSSKEKHFFKPNLLLIKIPSSKKMIAIVVYEHKYIVQQRGEYELFLARVRCSARAGGVEVEC